MSLKPCENSATMLLHNLNALSPLRGCSLSIGNFDGVHAGHQVLLKSLVSQAKAANAKAVVLTFEPHPLKLLRPEINVPRLTTLVQKSELLHQAGVDAVVAYPTDTDLLNLSAEQFFQQIVIDKLAASGVVEGPNFFFGKDRQGTPETLEALCRQHQLTLDIVIPQESEGSMVSSSRVRSFLDEGDVRTASQLLGRHYSITGLVGTGEQRGRTIGFPTANITQIETLIPAHGVYAATCTIDQNSYGVALNIGPNPTFGTDELKIEAHLLDFAGDLYGQMLTVELIERIRGVQTFSSAEELQTQLKIDIKKIREVIAIQDSATAS